MKRKTNIYRVDKYNRPVFKIIFSNGDWYHASPDFTLDKMTPELVKEFKEQLHTDHWENYAYDDDEYVTITQIRFASTKGLKRYQPLSETK